MFTFSVFPAYITVKITPGARETKIQEILEDGTVKILVAAPPEKGKANAELKKFFKKNWNYAIHIIAGETDRKKLLRIEKGI